MIPQYSQNMLEAIEFELQRQVARLDSPRTGTYYEMLTYHMGWSGDGAGPEARGKRIRPLLLLLTAASCGADWRPVLPAAAAVELVHNFSLIHDDIQDSSRTRRGRATLWTKWGLAQAINAGDGMFALSNLAILDLAPHFPADVITKVAQVLIGTSLELTRGQFLDISYEKRMDLSAEDYWPMVSGKTAALLSACCAMGAILGGANEPMLEAYRSFGHYLGLAFQVQDDILGIWGDEALTGKSTASDLLEGKKSLPVLVGLGKKGKFAARWLEGSIRPDEVQSMAALLASEGGYGYAQDVAQQMTDYAINSAREADPQGEPGAALMELADKLLKREA